MEPDWKEQRKERRREKRHRAQRERDRYIALGMPMAAFLVADQARIHPGTITLNRMLAERPTSALTTYAWLALYRGDRVHGR